MNELTFSLIKFATAAQFLKTVPDYPGIYQMFDNMGKVLYIGKARRLKQRLKSYFQKNQLSAKTSQLMHLTRQIEFTTTATENEALLLESNLIKKHLPPFNVLLRDDKSYPYIFISNHNFPRIDLYRGAKNSKTGKYYGPYPSVAAVRETLYLLQKLFKLRQCQDTFFNARVRPCLQYQINRCSAPCVANIDVAAYQKSVYLARLFLEGKNQQIIEELTTHMDEASQQLQFEKAAKVRDQLIKLRQIQERQKIHTSAGDVDIIVGKEEAEQHSVHVLTVRGGRILGSKNYFPTTPKLTAIKEVLQAFIEQYYTNPVRQETIPKEIILNEPCEEPEILEQTLSALVQHKVSIRWQVRGDRAAWLEMAGQNANIALHNHVAQRVNMYQRFEAIARVFNLANIPEHIECFDISHSLGEATVAACVVFTPQGAARSEYRRFNIKGVTKGDDYGALRQALSRRYVRLKSMDFKLPEIIFIDGGKGQLRQAVEVLEELQITGTLMVGIAKGPDRKPGLETLFVAGVEEAVHLPSHHLALHAIQQIRDEAHRFAIVGHRKQRAKQKLASPLEEIPNIGPKRRLALLRHFGGWQGLRKASIEQIASVPGINRTLAEAIYEAVSITGKVKPPSSETEAD